MLSRAKAGILHTRSSEKDRTQRLTRRNRGLPSLDHSAALCRQRNTLYSATLLYTYISRFSVNPHHQQREKIRQSYRHGSISSRFSTSPTNGPRSLSRAKVGTHSALLKESHTRAHTAKQGAFRMGVVSLPSDRFAQFGNPARPGVRTANFAAFRPWSGALPENAESLRNSDALMCVAVPRRRCPAGLRDLFRFCRNRDLYIRRSWFSACARQGRYHYPRCAPRAAETLGGRMSKRLICRFLRSGSLH